MAMKNDDQNVPLSPKLAHVRPPPSNLPSKYELLIIAPSFRDGERCGKMILSALKTADHPERLRFAFIDQVLPEDATCVEAYCRLAKAEGFSVRGEERGDEHCPYVERIKFEKVDALESKGPMVARARAQKLVGEEEFCLSIDCHSTFTEHWDSIILKQWLSVGNEMAVLSAYPPPIGGSSPTMSYYMCEVVSSKSGVGEGFVRMSSPHRVKSTLPLLQPYWGAGFSFSKCHAERRVPIDPLTDWVFDGEEFSRALSLWTNGYDMYGPQHIPIEHDYNPVPHNVYQRYATVNAEKNVADGKRAINRLKLQAGVPFDERVNTTDISLYSPGTVRTVAQYKAFSGVNVLQPDNSESNCGKVLHWMPYDDVRPLHALPGIKDWLRQYEAARCQEQNREEGLREKDREAEVLQLRGMATRGPTLEVAWNSGAWLLLGAMLAIGFLLWRKRHMAPQSVRRALGLSKPPSSVL